MYGSIGNFIKAILLEFLTIFLFVNIVFAFNLHTELGLPNLGYGSLEGDTYGYYFGVGSFIDAFRAYYTKNYLTVAFTDAMNDLLDLADYLDIGRVFNKLLVNPSLEVQSEYPAIANLQAILRAITGIFNVFVNIPYTIVMVIYFLIFLVYVISLVIQFVIFVFYIFSGYFYKQRTDTYGIYTNLILTRLTF